MKRLGGYLLEFVYWLEVLYLFLAFLGLLAFAFNLIGLEEIRRAAAWPWKEILLYVLAALSLVAFLHFLFLTPPAVPALVSASRSPPDLILSRTTVTRPFTQFSGLPPVDERAGDGAVGGVAHRLSLSGDESDGGGSGKG